MSMNTERQKTLPFAKFMIQPPMLKSQLMQSDKYLEEA